ncbi:hypothetical protein Hte_011017 [Hypoxylon texense]
MSSSEISGQQALDVDRHAGEQAPSDPIPKPTIGSSFELDPEVIKEGEFESLRALGTVSRKFVPFAYGWGKFGDKTAPGEDVYFLLTSFHNVGQQPPADPSTFTARLADLHQRSKSPNGKFGFHTKTCLARLPQVTDHWEESWAALYKEQLQQLVRLDYNKNKDWGAFHPICSLILDKVIPRLLEPLQSEGRSIKPCLVHGDLWDENTATDAGTGEPFIFDACSFYAHNEYELGNWRAARHRLSAPAYIESYKQHFPPSEPSKSRIPLLISSAYGQTLII